MEIVAIAEIHKMLAMFFGGACLNLNTRPFYRYVHVTSRQWPVFLEDPWCCPKSVSSVWQVIKMVTLYFLWKKGCARKFEDLPKETVTKMNKFLIFNSVAIRPI
jgi:hypothetical protein